MSFLLECRTPYVQSAGSHSEKTVTNETLVIGAIAKVSLLSSSFTSKTEDVACTYRYRSDIEINFLWFIMP